MGRTAQLPDSEMVAFSDFVLPLVYPPNPYQLLDRIDARRAGRRRPSAKRGQNVLHDRCACCPATWCATTVTRVPAGTNGQIINDAKLLQDQDIKIPQLRNLYTKTGFRDVPGAVNKRGFGFTHDGIDRQPLQLPHVSGVRTSARRRRCRTRTAATSRRSCSRSTPGIAPSVGHRITFDGTNNANPVRSRASTRSRPVRRAGNCELIAKGRIGGQPRGWVLSGGGQWQPDEASQSRTLTAPSCAHSRRRPRDHGHGVPIGSGKRMGIDRDRDALSRWRRAGGRQRSRRSALDPEQRGVPGGRSSAFGIRAVRPNPFRSAAEVSFTLGRAGNGRSSPCSTCSAARCDPSRPASARCGPAEPALGWKRRRWLGHAGRRVLRAPRNRGRPLDPRGGARPLTALGPRARGSRHCDNFDPMSAPSPRCPTRPRSSTRRAPATGKAASRSWRSSFAPAPACSRSRRTSATSTLTVRYQPSRVAPEDLNVLADEVGALFAQRVTSCERRNSVDACAECSLRLGRMPESDAAQYDVTADPASHRARAPPSAGRHRRGGAPARAQAVGCAHDAARSRSTSRRAARWRCSPGCVCSSCRREWCSSARWRTGSLSVAAYMVSALTGGWFALHSTLAPSRACAST